RAQLDAVAPVRLERHRGAELDGDGEHVAADDVGVLPDEVDPPRGHGATHPAVVVPGQGRHAIDTCLSVLSTQYSVRNGGRRRTPRAPPGWCPSRVPAQGRL